jgi:hypothetical protein
MFGLATQYDTGVNPSVSINTANVVVEVHKAEVWDKSWYHVGKIRGSTIEWGNSRQYDDGITPAVALNLYFQGFDVRHAARPSSLSAVA